MNLENFKTYLKDVIKHNSEMIEELSNKISLIPPLDQINLNEFGPKKTIIELYFKKHKRKLIHKFISPQDNELKKFIRSEWIKEYTNELDKLKKINQELIDSLNKIGETTFINSIYPNSELVNELLNYSLQNHIHPAFFIKTIISLFKLVKKKQNDFISTIEHDYAGNFDLQGNILEEVNIHSLIFTTRKIFNVLIYDNLTESKKAYLNEVINYLSSLKEEPIEESKKTSSLDTIESYIKDDHIIKIPSSIEDFVLVLDRSNLSSSEKKSYLNFMKIEIERRKEKDYRRINEILPKYLSNEDMNLMDTANKVIITSNDVNIQDLVNRARNDIISLCKYLELIAGTDEVTSMLDILEQRISTLRLIIKNSKTPVTNSESFYYLTDRAGNPNIIESISLIDITFYHEIYDTLTKLAHKEIAGKKINTISGINFYHLFSDSIKISYAEKDDVIILIDASISNLFNYKHQIITDEIVNRVKEILTRIQDEEYKHIHLTYEKMLVQQLDLSRSCYNLTLHQTDNQN